MIQDADFIDEPVKKKSKKGKHKAEVVVEIEGLSVDEKAKRVRDAMEEYKKLDHEDMVRL